MAKNSIDAYGAKGKGNLLNFDPEDLVLVTDETSPLYDERVHLPVDEALARNIDYEGKVIQPIQISKNPETGAVEVVVGRQRVKACRLANQWRHERGDIALRIPAAVYQGERRKALSAIVSENEARRNDTPLTRAQKMQRLLASGRDESEIATIFCCSQQTVRASLRLLECSSSVQQAVESGQINVSHAKILAALSPDEQRAKVKDLIAAGDGAKPHERARKQREVLGNAKPRMKTRKQILAELEADPSGERGKALRWVLGMDEPAMLPGLVEAKKAMRDFEAQAAA